MALVGDRRETVFLGSSDAVEHVGPERRANGDVEEAFDISFEPEEMMELEDVNDIVKAVEEKLT